MEQCQEILFVVDDKNGARRRCTRSAGSRSTGKSNAPFGGLVHGLKLPLALAYVAGMGSLHLFCGGVVA
jgi:hypothetical protein